jgi:predicted GIY-YIG superfamily endonuclease
LSEEIYTYKKNGLKIFSRVPIPKKSGDYVYFIKIGNDRLYKIGTTNRPLQRIKEHLKNYSQDIEILWFSPCYAEFTPVRIERNFIREYKNNPFFHYVPKDRFIIDNEVAEVIVKVRKEYPITL